MPAIRKGHWGMIGTARPTNPMRISKTPTLILRAGCHRRNRFKMCLCRMGTLTPVRYYTTVQVVTD